MPTHVIGIHFSNITTTTIVLTWHSKDQNAPNYSYRIVVEGNGSETIKSTSNTTALIRNLEPGTLYIFTINAQVAGTDGDANNGSTFTSK